jgi:excinuclease ABC subunit C
MARSISHRIDAASRSGLRRLVLRDCPRRAGVYGMLNPRDEVIYVGKAKCLRTRLLSYFRRRGGDRKARRILQHTAAIAWETSPNEFAALLRELELIQRWRPRFNVRGQPGRRRLTHLCLGRSPAPHVFLSSAAQSPGLTCYGPVRAGWRAREAVRHLNDYFRLRDCPKKLVLYFREERKLFPEAQSPGCLRLEIGTCLGPCVGACSRREYRRQTSAIRAFLEGRDDSPLRTVEEEMKSASSLLQFEKAAALRDKLDSLSWIHGHLKRLRTLCQQPPFIYPVRGNDGTETWYLVQNGLVISALAPPRSVSEKRAVSKRIRDALEGKPATGSRLNAANMDCVYLVAAWFRRHPEERERVLERSEALRFSGSRSREDSEI